VDVVGARGNHGRQATAGEAVMSKWSGHVRVMAVRARALAVLAAATVVLGAAGSSAQVTGHVPAVSTSGGRAQDRDRTIAERFRGRYQLRLPQARTRATA
jgi:hypothetical protein